jgi:hypothetical protein
MTVTNTQANYEHLWVRSEPTTVKHLWPYPLTLDYGRKAFQEQMLYIIMNISKINAVKSFIAFVPGTDVFVKTLGRTQAIIDPEIIKQKPYSLKSIL